MRRWRSATRCSAGAATHASVSCRKRPERSSWSATAWTRSATPVRGCCGWMPARSSLRAIPERSSTAIVPRWRVRSGARARASGGRAPGVANADRISEVYKGEIWDEMLQQRARNRINWLTSHARGHVLDVGCSQGIASLLAARAGHHVVGVDVELDRVAYALDDRAKQEPDIAQRVLAPSGVVAITVPFGLSPHHDHRDTFYAANLLDLVGGHLLPQSIEIVERYLRIVATNGVADAARLAELLASVQPTADRLFAEVERAEYDSRQSMRELARRSRQLVELERQVG